jgi:cell division septum initiation protein DivIVA
MSTAPPIQQFTSYLRTVQLPIPEPEVLDVLADEWLREVGEIEDLQFEISDLQHDLGEATRQLDGALSDIGDTCEAMKTWADTLRTLAEESDDDLGAGLHDLADEIAGWAKRMAR